MKEKVLDKIPKQKGQIKTVPTRESPKVGIFWIDLDKKKVRLVFADPLGSISVTTKEETVSGDYDHYPLWESLKHSGLLPDQWMDKEYEYVPRGRVVYDGKRRRFRVYASKKIVRKKWFQERILSEFFLPREATVFEEDLHYEDPRETLLFSY